MATQNAFFTVSDRSSSYISPAVDALGTAYSMQVNLSGTYNADIKLQGSLDGQNWVDIEGSSELALSANPESVIFDVHLGLHRFVRVSITHNSGSFTAEGFISNGYWKAI